MLARSLLAAAILLAPAASLATACSVPCGYIYPLILIDLGVERTEVFNIARESPLALAGKLTFRFDMVNEGFTAPDPRQPIVVSFEFPRKPEWAEIVVEPSRLDIPMTPEYVHPDVSDPTNPRSQYVYEHELTVTVRVVGQPVLADGAKYAKLLVFAKSTESGLYKSGYGVKELRVLPAGAIRASDAEEGPVPIDAGGLPLLPVNLALPGATIRVTPPQTVSAWVPQSWSVALLPEAGGSPAGRIVASAIDSRGAVAFSTGLVHAPDGRAAFNLTLPSAGRHTLAVWSEPLVPADGAWLAGVVAFDFVVPPGVAEAVRYPATYSATISGLAIPERADPANPALPFERILPFPVLGGANGAKARVALGGPGVLRADLVDGTGAVLATATADPTVPVREVAAAGLPTTGTYWLRLSGLGTPATTYDAALTVTYESSPVDDGERDPGPVSTFGPYAFSVSPASGDAWEPVALTAASLSRGNETSGEARVAFTHLDEGGHARYVAASRPAPGGSASVRVTPEPGTNRLLAAFVPGPGASVPAAIGSLEFEGSHARASTYEQSDEAAIPHAPSPVPAALVNFTVLPGARSLQVRLDGEGLLTLTGRGTRLDGKSEYAIDTPDPGDYLARVDAGSLAGGTFTIETEVGYAVPPGSGGSADPNGAPGFEAAILLSVLALLVLIQRRKQ